MNSQAQITPQILQDLHELNEKQKESTCLEELWNLSQTQEIFIRHLNENREILREMPPNEGQKLVDELLLKCQQMQ